MPNKINILSDGIFDIATGRSRKEISWKNKEMQWSDLVEKLSTTHVTAETHNEYISSKKIRQDEIKDIGGFVGGFLTGGRRKASNILHRQLLTLDIDFCNNTFWEDFIMFYDWAALVYSTHKHSPESPRLRLIVPLDRPVRPDEYEAIARKLAGEIDIELFDPTTFQPERLMYWPSTSKGAAYVFEYQDGPWLSADNILSSYRDWKDSSEWPVSFRVDKLVHRSMVKQGDPLEKGGVVGAFCRTYTIQESIDIFLNDVYELCDIENRYSYKEGSTAAGLVVYDDKYAYSHHGTDPTGGKLCNAFDLVRLHKYGLRDEDVREGTPINKFPSYLAMELFCQKDLRVVKQIGVEKMAGAHSDFAGIDTESGIAINEDWLGEMEVDRKGNYLSTRYNFKLILENDPKLKGKFAFDLFGKKKVILKDLDWRKVTEDTQLLTDEDECDLRIYLANKPYNMSHNSNLKDVFDSVIAKQIFHPVKDYMATLKWDGVKRVDTLFIDYMGATDSAYTRAVTRKSLVAAVARIYQPGIQFHHVLTLVGEEGKHKSSIFRKLAKKWFSDTFSFKMLERGKEAFEQLQGYWIIEIGELAGIKKAEVESIKQFITKTDDVYRIPHKQYTSQFKRQCVFFGTTNKWDFLSSNDGNRRFWPVPILVEKPSKDPGKDLTEAIVDQIWAEVIEFYKQNETLYLSKEIEMIAKELQTVHTEKDDRVGAVEKYLETLLPDGWEEMTTYEKRAFLAGDELQPEGKIQKNKTCVAEIWCELFGGQLKDLNSYNTKGLHTIMQHMKGWVRSGQKRFKNYGRQVSYERIGSLIDGLIVTSDGNLAMTGSVIAKNSNDGSNDGSNDEYLL